MRVVGLKTLKNKLSEYVRIAAGGSRGPVLEIIPEVVERARAKLTVRVRTLDALHLASARFLIEEGVDLQLATYDERMRKAARTLKIELYSNL